MIDVAMPAKLGELIDLLQSKGVRFFEGAGVKLRLDAPVTQTTDADLKALGQPEQVCKCSHPMAAHMNGACVFCGDAAKCGEETK